MIKIKHNGLPFTNTNAAYLVKTDAVFHYVKLI